MVRTTKLSETKVHTKTEESFSEGLYYFFGGGCDDARALYFFDKTINLDKKHYWAHYCKGMILFFNGNLEEAEKCLKTVVEIHWAHTPAWSNLAGIQTKLGKTCEAENSRKMTFLTNQAYTEEIKLLNQAAKSI